MNEIKYLSNNSLTYLSDKLQSTFGLKTVSDKLEDVFNLYLLDLDYKPLEFDTSIIITGNSTSAVLGIGQLGVMILGTS